MLISPISWDNHWVWIVPLLAILADAAVRARGRARWGYLALAAALAAVFADWPAHWTGPHALVPHGLVGFFTGRHPKIEIFHLHGWQLLGWNLYVLAGLVIFICLVVAAFRARRAALLPDVASLERGAMAGGGAGERTDRAAAGAADLAGRRGGAAR